LEAINGNGLKRQVDIRPHGDPVSKHPLWFQAHQGKNLKLQDNTCTNQAGLTVRLENLPEGAVLWQDPDDSGSMQWRIPVGGQRTLEVTYQW
jgi:hypothetical protein